MRVGWLIERSTGKPTTWGRTRRKRAARKGNSCRTLSGRITMNLDSRGTANGPQPAKGAVCAEASVTEEPDAEKLHVRVCAGGAR